jgi:hypothetical protein
MSDTRIPAPAPTFTAPLEYVAARLRALADRYERGEIRAVAFVFIDGEESISTVAAQESHEPNPVTRQDLATLRLGIDALDQSVVSIDSRLHERPAHTAGGGEGGGPDSSVTA